MNAKEICNIAIGHFGMTTQILKLIEELGELTRASSRIINGSDDQDYEKDMDNLYEEIADVEILLEQIKGRLNPEALVFHKTTKLLRLQKMLVAAGCVEAEE